MKAQDASARERLLRAALKHFAERGYAGASVQDIVDDAKVTKPTLYYYFGNKAGLYHALIDLAYDERLRLLQESVIQAGPSLEAQLISLIQAQFEFARRNRELMRIGFATMFAAPREVPNPAYCLARAQRNFNFVVQLVREAQQRREIDPALDATEATLAIYGMMAFHVLAHLANPDHGLNQTRAQFITRVFLQGLHGAQAASRQKSTPAPPPRRRAIHRKSPPAFRRSAPGR
ncbi:MAG: TetR/AcrR family transcriptional regulator [Verrucomicrobiae bacterium]|nr:TetR/AcrR family transcriptional regulator [Verrucomicrobiae bacterium]